MYPYIHTDYGDISVFSVAVVTGLAAMFLLLHFQLKKQSNSFEEENYIYPKLVISFLAAYLFAALFDAFFKLEQNEGFVIKGITFYGGLIGGSACMLVLLLAFRKNTDISVWEWFNTLTAPVIVFHIFGRLGCFMAGCCYGKETEFCLGVVFPDLPDKGIYHMGEKCFPTQLFEAVALLLILIIVLRVKERFLVYLLSYSVARFFIEMLRGDNRGQAETGLSPAQNISILIFSAVIIVAIIRYYMRINKDTDNAEICVQDNTE